MRDRIKSLTDRISNWAETRLYPPYDEQIADYSSDGLASELQHQRKMTLRWGGVLAVGATLSAVGWVEDIPHAIEYLSLLSNSVEVIGLNVSYARTGMVRERIEPSPEQA